MSPPEPVVCKKHHRRIQGNGYIRAVPLYVITPPYLGYGSKFIINRVIRV